MQPEGRAILFDLDDTLYPLRDFRMSAFRAVAEHLETLTGADAAQSMWYLTHEAQAKGRELQALLEGWQLPETMLPDLLSVVREHTPTLRLPVVSLRMLTTLRATWRLGILTNGPVPMQSRKIAALGLEPLVDLVVYANEHGSGVGKPEAVPFLHSASSLGVEAPQVVVVGDDEVRDVAGAIGAGMRSVRLTAWTGPCRHSQADAVITSLVDLPALAETLVHDSSVSHVA